MKIRPAIAISKSLWTRYSGFWLVLAAAAAVLGSWPAASQAQTQLTTEMLIGDSVADLGPKYSDVDEAIKRFTNGDVLSARALLAEAQKKSPTLPPVDLMLARMYLISGAIPNGRAALETTASENPTDPEAYILLAEIDLSQGGTTEAEALYEKALSLTETFNANPKRKRNFGIRARWGRAQVYERRKNWPAMENDLQTLLKIDDHHAAGRFKLGVAMCRQNRFTEGKAAFDAAQKDDEKKTLPKSWVTIALLYDQMGKPDNAKKAFLEALREDQNDLAANIQYAQWLIKTGAYDEAETRTAAARKAHPEALDGYILSGAAALMKGKLKEAEDFFVTALGQAPGRLDVINQLALLLIDQNNPQSKERAQAFAELNAKANENSADALITLAWVYFKLNRPADANKALRTALQRGNLTPDSSYLVAVMISGTNQPEQIDGAKKLLTEALTADTSGIFIHRKEAQELLKKLGGG